MLAFDHIVVASPQPKKAAEQFANQHRLVHVEGGRHSNWGTYNSLCHLSNHVYIEWLGIEHPNTARHSHNPLIQHLHQSLQDDPHTRPIQLAFRTTQLDNLIHHMNTEGIGYAGPFPGERQKPDGSQLKWRMLFPQHSSSPGLLPFLIEWEGDHLPSDSTVVNDSVLKAVELGVSAPAHSVQLFEQIYQLKFDSDRTSPALENGSLRINAGSDLRVQFSQFTLE
ncbi:VOC family protein [Thalassobacillus sp. CUG 92003]|uniref:VOC family protein n=1 Tax=Thalassobacillus sp. CUG 92003 TaxID=2736641 RepID=UPI0015E78A51|nr:VOC family protein [Thalassobacillus sp. CUG 92003]